MENIVIQSIVVDTLNEIQNAQYGAALKKKGKANFDDWTDYGVDLYMFIKQLVNFGFEIVLILGKEGSGKSYGMKSLTPGTYVWFNADAKNPTFKRDDLHKSLYGFKPNFKDGPGPLMKIPKTYDEIIGAITSLKGGITTPTYKLSLTERPIAFLLGHTEEYKGPEGEIMQRLKVLGKLATKMNVSGLFEHTYMSEMTLQGGKAVGRFRVQNNGTDSARSPEGMYDEVYIPNDYNYIINAINNY
jgi:hypothetical protein